ncbi:Polyphosphate kinase [Candidatus Providencia siddallii]|uniref:Polyphosphate kinase n=1 Tax=Candidatus Providencia siddallii TaxID=1715285 RepID=A0A0M6W7G0_9GAMM|nr:Polyphosphate kinase [Candidatus Providencia siddallii]
MYQNHIYHEKELTYLSFNERVLQEAADKNNSIIERMRFLNIYTNNLDEFCKIRFSDIKKRVINNKNQNFKNKDFILLQSIKLKIFKQEYKFDYIYNELLNEITSNQIYLIDEKHLSNKQKKWISKYFIKNLRQYVIPVLIKKDTNLVNFLKDNYIYLAIEIINKNKIQYALLEIPSNGISRFIKIPPETSNHQNSIILIDDILRYNLNNIFKEFFIYEKLNAYYIKITRDNGYKVHTKINSNLLKIMSLILKQRLRAKPIRLIYQHNMPNEMVSLLIKKLNLSKNDFLMPGGFYSNNFKDFKDFFSKKNNCFSNKTPPQLRHSQFNNYSNIFNVIRERDILLYYPYYTFEHTLELLQQASFDPKVLSIKINIYRLAKKSRIINSIIHAAHNGKKVTVVIELQARFEEEANIHWAKYLTEAGVHVVFSVLGFKIHAKLFIISRIENGLIVSYAHIGTGNFNEKTAQTYTDYSLFTANKEITEEVFNVFNFIENPYTPVTFNNLIVSPKNSRTKLYSLINQEIKNAILGLPSGITLKLNKLVDKELVNQLYNASNAGVTIKLLVRDMCSLIARQNGYSENIQIISIVDKFLEHDRVYVFTNAGDTKVFISSADWMTRNIDYRIEVAVQLLDKRLKQLVLNILKLQFNDTVKARYIDKYLHNHYVQNDNNNKIRSQVAIYKFLKSFETSISKI